jgi:hypothetical protein
LAAGSGCTNTGVAPAAEASGGRNLAAPGCRKAASKVKVRAAASNALAARGTVSLTWIKCE